MHQIKSKTALLLIILMIAGLLALPSPLQAQDISVNVNGTSLGFDVPPQMIEGRVLVPVRAIFEALGATISWDPVSQQVTAIRGNTTVILYVNNTEALINGQPSTLDVPATLYQDRVMVPARFVSEALGGTVQWDEVTQTVTIVCGGAGITARVLNDQGKVYIKSGSSQTRTEVKGAAACSVGDKIETGSNSRAELRFTDGSSILLTANTSIDLVDLQGGTQIDYLELNLEKGRIFGYARQQGGSAGDGSRLRKAWWKDNFKKNYYIIIDMPWGITGIRGTIWSNDAGSVKETTSVDKGSVDYMAAETAVTIAAGQASYAGGPDAAPSTPAAMSAEEKAQWESVQDWYHRADTINSPGKHSIVMTVGSASALIDGASSSINHAPMIVSGCPCVSLTAVANVIGGRTTWDSANRTAIIDYGRIQSTFTVAKATYTLNGTAKPVATPVFMDNMVVMAPVRDLAFAFNAAYDYDPASGTISVYYQ